MSETATDHNFRVIDKKLQVINENVILISKQNSAIEERVIEIDDSVHILHKKQDQISHELDKLSRAFDDYVGEYRRKTELQLAETQIVKIRQELERKFGYYAEIRRMATGILQAVDSNLVTNETIQNATEEVMIKAPGYWLAPTLVCVAAWLRNDKATSLRAVGESIKRDDYKTTLFFTLLTRRLNRQNATIKWLERYFLHQDPGSIDREFIIILESVSTGAFPPASKEIMIRHVKEWVVQLTQTDDYIDKQKANWLLFFNSKKSNSAISDYPILKEFATNWNELQTSLQTAKANVPILNHFNQILSSGVIAISAYVKQLDKLLNSLVTNFDDEELPLKKNERMCELVIEKHGDKDAAMAVMATEEKIFDEKIDFLQMLTNAAFNPEKSGASAATQALAVSISQPWILESYNTFIANYRADIPATVQFDIDGFIESSEDGSEEKDLLYKQNVYYEKMKDDLIENAKFPFSKIIIPALLTIFGIFMTFSEFPKSIGYILVAAIGAFWIFRVWKRHENYKESIEQQIEDRKKKAAEVLRGLLAEIVIYRAELNQEDNESSKMIVFLDNINSEQFMSLSQGAARSILTI